MSIKIMTEVWEKSPARGTELFLLIALADFANDSGECWPAVETLAKKIRSSRRSVQRLLRNLEESHLITCLEGGGRESNRYIVHTGVKLTPPPTAAPVSPHRRHIVAPPAAPVSPDPLGTIKEPSIPETTELKAEAERFVDWFLKLLSLTGAPLPRLSPTVRSGWADAYEKLCRIDGKEKTEIIKVCEWARADAFWSGNFFSPVKLRDRKDGVSRYDLFLSKLKSPNGNARTQTPNPRLNSNSHPEQYAIFDR